MNSQDSGAGQDRPERDAGADRWRRVSSPTPESGADVGQTLGRRTMPEREDRGRSRDRGERSFSNTRRDDSRPGWQGGRAGGGRDDRRGRDERDRDRSGPTRGPRSWDRRDKQDGADRDRRDPQIPEDITGKELDRAVWRELRTLSKENAEGVAQHLVASAVSLEEDPDLALQHAQTAARRAGRVPAVREALGLVHYRRGEFADALREFRTARRLSGSHHLLPYMVDCERGLGRLQRALDLAASPEAKELAEADNIELAIVVSGVRRDLGQPEAALMGLRLPALQRAKSQPWAARLLYAYAEALLATGDEAAAQDWFARATVADQEQETDAAERLAELQGIVLEDLEELSDEAEDSGPEEPEDNA